MTATNKEARNKLEAVKRQQENKVRFSGSQHKEQLWMEDDFVTKPLFIATFQLKQLRKLKAKEKSLRNKLHEGTDAETPNQTVEGTFHVCRW